MEILLSEIKIENRHRKNLGDINELVDSIRRVGLLMPVAVTPEKRLIAGERRVEAFRRMGRDRIPAHVVRTVEEAVKLLLAERDENTCRIPHASLEALELARKIEAIEKPKARERQAEGQRKGGGDHRSADAKDRSPGSSRKPNDRSANETRNIAAKGTGYSEKTLRRVAEVEKAANSNPRTYGDLADKLGNHGTKVESVYKEFTRRQEKEKLEAAAREAAREVEAAGKPKPDVRHCRMEELLPSLSSVDAIITDPPYPKEFLPLYGELARLAAKCLSPAGVLAVMCGQSYLPDILALMSPHIAYRWTMAYLTPGGQSVQLWDRKVNTFWKPILIFGTADKKWLGDVVHSDVNDNDKRYHGWGQSESGMGRLIDALTKPGQLICDPFTGAGTTGVAAVKLARKFIGCDCDKEHVENSKKRIIVAMESMRAK